MTRFALVVLLVNLWIAGSHNLPSSERNDRQLINIVRFKNFACTATSGITGACMSSDDCSSNSGSASGNCASGFGVCCVFIVQCGGTVKQNCTYIQNPSYPSSDSTFGTCAFTIQKCSNDICSIRLDFVKATLDAVATDTTDLTTFGDCSTGKLDFATGSGRNPGAICGEFSGQHIYLDAGSGTSTTTLTLTGSGTFRYKISQYSCADGPPPGCDQYYTGLSGTIKTYNFPAYHLNDQNINACVKQADGYCEITYTPNDDNSFTLSGSATKAKNGNLCSKDYVQISNARNIQFDVNSDSCLSCDSICGATGVATSSSDRFCGQKLSCVNADTTQQTLISTDFSVNIITDADELAGEVNANDVRQGVCLNYNQVAC